MRVATHDGIDTSHATGHLQVHIHAVVRQNDHNFCTLGTNFVDHFLHVVVLNTKGPVSDHVTRIGNWGVWEGLTNHSYFDTIHFTNHIGIKYLVTEVIGFDVLSQERNLAFEIFFNNLFHTIFTKGHFPVWRHDVNTQGQAGIDHVLTVGPQGSA